MEKISVIVPCFNEEHSVPLFYAEIYRLAEKMSYVDFEFIFIDDGSSDGTLDQIRTLVVRDERVKFTSFSRNFQKEAAMYAGLQRATGDYAVIIDCDLQHPPKYIETMYLTIQEQGCDCVAVKRKNRKGEPRIRSFFSKLFYKIINKISATTIAVGATDYRLMKRRMVDAVLKVTEYNRFSKGIFEWVGFETQWIAIVNEERQAGSSTWSFWSLLCYSMDGFIAFSTKPLQLSSLLGFLLFFLAIFYGLYIVVKTVFLGESVAGWPTLTCLILFLSGCQLLCTGILGQYIAKSYLETKRRPIFIAKETDQVIPPVIHR